MKFLMIALSLLPKIGIAQISIDETRKLKTGKIVTVAGRVTAAREFGSLSFIQDGTGGIAVYKGNINAIGDSVVVTGELAKYNGLLEIISDSVRLIVHKAPLSPRVVTKLNNYEGQLVRIENVRAEPQGLFFYPQRSGVVIKGNDTTRYWIDENTDIPGYSIPSTTSITGIAGRYGNRFQLMPRSHEDIDNIVLEHTSNQQPNSLKVMNWNLEFFGAPRYGPSNDMLQLNNVTTIISESRADVIALQEVSNDQLFRQLVQNLPGYDGRCSSRYSYSFDPAGDFPPQKLCFLYNTSVVKVLREKILFRKMFDEAPSDIFASGRLPYVIDLEVNKHRLSVINIHAKSGATTTDRDRRATDARILKDSLDVYYANKEWILLGDFNDDLDESISPNSESPYAVFTSNPRYHCISKKLTDAGWHSTIPYDDMIDHQVISSTLNDRYIEGSVSLVNVFASTPLFERTTSDHLPVISGFDFNKTITGIQRDPEITAYPNPFSNELWFTPVNSDLTLRNSMGTVILKMKSAQPPILTGKCAPGIYFLTIGDQTIKIMKSD